MSTSELPTDDSAVFKRLGHFLDTQQVAAWEQKSTGYWQSPEGRRETIVNQFQRAKAFLVLEQREDLLDEWIHQRFQVAMNAWIPHLPCERLPGEPPLKGRDDRAAQATEAMATWREQLGPKAWAQAMMVRPSSHEDSPLTKLLTRPNGLDWALQALNDGATLTHARAFGTAIHRGREDVVAALIAAGADPNGSPNVHRPQDLPLGMPVKHEVINRLEVQRRIREALVTAGADVNRLTGSDSLLHQAALRGEEDEVCWLLVKGANPNNSWTHNGQTYSTLTVMRTHQDSLPQAAAIAAILEHAQALTAPTPDSASPARRRRSP